MSINIPENFHDKGLKKIEINRLGSTVVVAGRNGAGKTRLLDLIHLYVNHHVLSDSRLAKINEQILSYENSLSIHPNSPNVETWQSSISALQDMLEIDSCFNLNSRQEYYTVLRFVPNNLSFSDSEMSRTHLKNAYNTAQTLGFAETMNQYVLPYIQYACDMNFEATHSKSNDNPKLTIYHESFVQLNNLISTFLGTTIGRNIEGYATIFGRDLGNAELSDGQKVLLQLCVQIHAQGASLNNLILILDEPENHLHPEAQIEFIKKTRETLTDGQIWIATHSIHILSYLSMTDIFYMTDGGIKYSGKEPERVLNGLLGGEDNVDNLQTFLASPAMYAANQFAYECLSPPTSAITRPDDKQTTQIATIIEKLKQNKKTITLLDYGAGTGRLLSSFVDNQDDPSSLHTWLDYIAFDKWSDDKTICENAISRAYSDCVNRYFNDREDLQRNMNDKSFDIAVMCNVLHEISPTEWVSTFNEDSLLFRLLSDDGYLLIVEDTAIPNGERPNKDGFFILGGTELKDLFTIPVMSSQANLFAMRVDYLLI